MNVNAGGEIENAAGKLPRSLIAAAIDSRQTLLIVGISAADDRVRGNPRCRTKFHAKTRRHVDAREISSRGADRAGDSTHRARHQIDLALEGDPAPIPKRAALVHRPPPPLTPPP